LQLLCRYPANQGLAEYHATIGKVARVVANYNAERDAPRQCHP
jgi:hypothetical protein